MFEFGLYLIFPYLYMVFMLIIFVVFIAFVLKILKTRKNGQIKGIDSSVYYRDIPCYKSLDLVYWLLYKFSDCNKNELNNRLIGAYLLLWYKKGYIDIASLEQSLFNNNNYRIDLKDGNWEKNYFESNLYNFLKKVAGNNNILEKNEIKNYCSVDGNSFEFNYLFKSALDEMEKNLVSNNLLKVISAKDYIFFKTESQYILSDTLLNEYRNLLGLKNFLLDFSCIDEKRYIEVHIWENYLIFANLLGIEEKVKEQFSKIYPSVGGIFSLVLGDFSNDDILTTVYKVSKIHLFSFLIGLFLVVLIFFTNIKFFLKILFFGGIILMLYFPLKKYFINKKVKEFNMTTYAKILDVEVHYDTEYDRDLKKDITTKRYSFKYEYNVGGRLYIGYGHTSKFIAPRKGQKVKIYYNGMKPENSETASEYNYYLKAFFVVFFVLLISFFLVLYSLN